MMLEKTFELDVRFYHAIDERGESWEVDEVKLNGHDIQHLLTDDDIDRLIEAAKQEEYEI